MFIYIYMFIFIIYHFNSSLLIDISSYLNLYNNIYNLKELYNSDYPIITYNI